ncbi:hypothetical protein CEXT_742881 [Caerostris extrusa]|uniref:Uncharacterized protein n=1 Tax=Caerostris extrusa TaxID=172846 RepID=A0AAV4WAA7_CAEEX|nr:hypothetical protein CEXT_742881 [Caerostris extrusa]
MQRAFSGRSDFQIDSITGIILLHQVYLSHISFFPPTLCQKARRDRIKRLQSQTGLIDSDFRVPLQCRSSSNKEDDGFFGDGVRRALSESGAFLLFVSGLCQAASSSPPADDFLNSDSRASSPLSSSAITDDNPRRSAPRVAREGAAAAPPETATPKGQEQPAEEKKSPHRLHPQPSVPAGVHLRHETLPIQLGTCRPGRLLALDGDTSENLVPEPTQQVEKAAGS